MIFIIRVGEVGANGPIIISNPTELACELDRRLQDRHGLVGIDGWTGVGKTTLAKEVAEIGGWNALDLDDFLNEDQGQFVESLRFFELGERIDSLGKRLILSGVCVLKVCERIGQPISTSVYLKRMASWGWADQCELDGTLPEFPDSAGFKLRAELREYHTDFQPHLRADIEFHRQS